MVGGLNSRDLAPNSIRLQVLAGPQQFTLGLVLKALWDTDSPFTGMYSNGLSFHVALHALL